MEHFNFFAGVSLFLTGTILLWVVARYHRRVMRSEVQQREWSRGFLWLILQAAIGFIVLGGIVIFVGKP